MYTGLAAMLRQRERTCRLSVPLKPKGVFNCVLFLAVSRVGRDHPLLSRKVSAAPAAIMAVQYINVYLFTESIRVIPVYLVPTV